MSFGHSQASSSVTMVLLVVSRIYSLSKKRAILFYFEVHVVNRSWDTACTWNTHRMNAVIFSTKMFSRGVKYDSLR